MADTGRGFSQELLSCFHEWVNRSHSELTYQATQIITGHGCFRGYTHRIGKSENDRCGFCGTNRENNMHVLIECENWREERAKLSYVYGREVISLGAIMRGMVADSHTWNAVFFIKFAKMVMDKKEEIETEEQNDNRRRRLIEESESVLEDRKRRIATKRDMRAGRE